MALLECLLMRSIVLLAATLAFACAPMPGGTPSASAAENVAGAGHPTAGPSTQPGNEAMDSAEFIQYTSRPELGYISITDNLIRGKKPVANLIAHQRPLAKAGTFAAVDRNRRHTFIRREKQAGRQINSLIVIDPPPPNADEDEKDAWTQHLIVKVDGHRKIDCTIGTSLDGNLLVYAINIFPADGSIEVVAVSGDGRQLDVSDDCQELDQPDVITDDSFDDADSEDDTPTRPPPLRTRFPSPSPPCRNQRQRVRVGAGLNSRGLVLPAQERRAGSPAKQSDAGDRT
jgi:hypothetical protein